MLIVMHTLGMDEGLCATVQRNNGFHCASWSITNQSICRFVSCYTRQRALCAVTLNKALLLWYQCSMMNKLLCDLLSHPSHIKTVFLQDMRIVL